VVFFFLSYVALAGVIWRGLNLIRGRALIPEGSKSSHDPIARHSDLPVRLKSLLNFVLAVTIIIGFVALQWRSEQGAWWGYARAYNLFGFLAHGWPHIQNPTATWFLAEAEPGSRVLNNQRFAARRLYFKTGGEFPVHSFLPHVPPDLRDRLDKASRTDPKVVRILYLQPTGGLGTGSLARRAYEAYLEEDLLGSIRSHEIRYLIVSNAVNGFLALYAELSPYFVQVAQPTPDIRVYRVDKEVLPLADWEIRIDPGIHAALKELRDESPEAYDRLVGEYFRDLLGLSPSEIEKLESGPYSQLGTESFTEDTFVRLLQGQGQHALEAAVALHREKAERIPGNPYPYLTLGALYAGMGDQEAAIDAYRRAGSVATDRVRAYLTLGQDYRPPAQPESRGEESVYATDRILDRIGPDLAAGQVSDQVHPSVFLVAGEPRRVLFQHPPSRISYRLQPSSSSYFRFGLSLDPEVWQPDKGDGVRFDLFVDDGNGSSHPYSQYIDPKTVPSDRMWHDGEIALSPWAGQAITLTLATSAGPAANSAYDWAGWGEPRVLQPAAFDFLATLPHADRGARGAKAVRQDVLTLGSEERTILFQHPPNRTTFQLAMPRRAGLHFGVGMDPRVWDPEKGDGVEYSIYVRDPDVPGVLHRVFNRYIDPKNDPADRRWYDAVVDLTAYGGKTVDVIFEALAGPAGDDGYDWGGWSWPVLIGDDMALRPRDWTGLILSEGDVP
jgi:hypothetical protein